MKALLAKQIGQSLSRQESGCQAMSGRRPDLQTQMAIMSYTVPCILELRSVALDTAPIPTGYASNSKAINVRWHRRATKLSSGVRPENRCG